MTQSTTGNKSPYYTVAVTGSSGLVGTALIDELQKSGRTINGKPTRVIPLTRGDGKAPLDEETPKTLSWNPNAPEGSPALDPSLLEQIDAVVHLAGENVATGDGALGSLGIQAWSDKKKDAILSSRKNPTRALAEAVRLCKNPPSVFLGASGVGVYGYDFFADSGDGVEADESSDTSDTTGFLAKVVRDWETAENTASSSRTRVVNMRFGVVLSKLGGALAKLYPIFFLGAGGNVGSGKQYFSFVSARDAARGIVHSLETTSLKGPVNICAPRPCTNSEFTSALGKVMGRPTLFPFPGFAVNLLFGEMGEEMLLGGTRAVPKKLVDSGFQFSHGTVEEALRSAIDEELI